MATAGVGMLGEGTTHGRPVASASMARRDAVTAVALSDPSARVVGVRQGAVGRGEGGDMGTGPGDGWEGGLGRHAGARHR
ncbi:hypothetical protein, partial [Streptomyces sp. NPDC005568]|uniref:hypothetical protein n=1 Tax=Streptomyces sp. NPDC005568 TaxID=3156887 RepID=UPI0033A124A7